MEKVTKKTNLYKFVFLSNNFCNLNMSFFYNIFAKLKGFED